MGTLLRELEELNVLFERLAAIEHERWSHWQQYVHDKVGNRNEDGSLTIPQSFVEHWDRQIATPYAELSEQEKRSDREQVDKYWPLITEPMKRLTAQRDELYVALSNLVSACSEVVTARADAGKAMAIFNGVLPREAAS